MSASVGRRPSWRAEPTATRYASLSADLFDTIPRRVRIDSDAWSGRRARRALRHRHTVCVDPQDLPPAAAEEASATEQPVRSVSPQLECRDVAVQQRISEWNDLVDKCIQNNTGRIVLKRGDQQATEFVTPAGSGEPPVWVANVFSSQIPGRAGTLEKTEEPASAAEPELRRDRTVVYASSGTGSSRGPACRATTGKSADDAQTRQSASTTASAPRSPRPKRLRHRHTITGLRPRRAPVVIVRDLTPSPPCHRRAHAAQPAVMAGGPAVLVQTWETRRNRCTAGGGGGGGGGHERRMRSPAPPVAGRASTPTQCESTTGGGGGGGQDYGHQSQCDLYGDGEWPTVTQEAATQTNFVSKVVRKAPAAANEVYVVRVCPPSAEQTSKSEVCATQLQSQARSAAHGVPGRTGQPPDTPPKPPRMLNIDSGLDFTRDPPSFSSLASSAGSSGGGGRRSSSPDRAATLAEAINHDLVQAHGRSAAAGHVLHEAQTVLQELDRSLEADGGGDVRRGQHTATMHLPADEESADHGFSSAFAAQIARESGLFGGRNGASHNGDADSRTLRAFDVRKGEPTAARTSKHNSPPDARRERHVVELHTNGAHYNSGSSAASGDVCDDQPRYRDSDARSEALSLESEARSRSSVSRSLESEAISLASQCRSPDGRRSESPQPSQNIEMQTLATCDGHGVPLQSLESRDDVFSARDRVTVARVASDSSSQRPSNVENYNLVEEITAGDRLLLSSREEAPDSSLSLSSGCDMGEVGVTRYQTPSTAPATPTPHSPVLAPPTCGVRLRSPSPGYASVADASDRQGLQPVTHKVVVAIDFGTTYSGYAFSFVNNPSSIHIMRKTEGGDPGVTNMKIPTALLLTPDCEFSAFGLAARDAYHDLDPAQAAQWLFFDKFKLSLHTDASLSLDTYIPAANGQCIQALQVFAHALAFFGRAALDELSDVAGEAVSSQHVRWVVTVPAIWRQRAKQFMRQAAYRAGLCSERHREDLLIALEPEVASVYCHSLHVHELAARAVTASSPESVGPTMAASPQSVPSRQEEGRHHNTIHVPGEMGPGSRYMVVDCGGGTVDITVHELLHSHSGSRRLKELFKASGGPYGSVGVDLQFEQLLCDLLGVEFVAGFRSRRPAAWMDLMVAFEARKRSVAPGKTSALNVQLPFSLIADYKKQRGKRLEQAVKNYRPGGVRYTDGMLRLEPQLMYQLFTTTLDKIAQQVENVLDSLPRLQYLFLVGGFAESQLLQDRVKRDFSHRIKIVIPQDVSLAILRGAVLFGMDPSVIQVRRSPLTYGVGVLNKFLPGIHPPAKLLVRDERQWCTDVFDRFVTADQSVGVGETLLRRYTPARADQTTIVLHLYCCRQERVNFVTDEGVERCGTLRLTLDGAPPSPSKRREIQVRMRFGDTELVASALDVASQRSVSAEIDFLGAH